MLLLLALGFTTPTLDRLVSANGFGVLTVKADHDGGPALVDFRDHIYQQYSPDDDPVWDLMYDARFGLVDADGAAWLTTGSGPSIANGTGIIEVDRSRGDLTITELAFAPMDLGWPAYVHLLRVRNDGAETTSVELFSLSNHHLGADRSGVAYGDEAIAVDGNWLLEHGDSTGLGMAVYSLTSPSSWSCDQIWERLTTERAFDSRCGSTDDPWINDDQVGGWQWSSGALEPSEEAWVGVVAGFYNLADPYYVREEVEAWVAGRGPEQLYLAEQALWETVHASAPLPDGASEDELAVYRQSLAALKMAQVRESNDAYGQIPASLPAAVTAPDGSFGHLWNITWVRDSAYAIVALTRAGFHQEAEDALRFLLQGKAGDYEHLVGQDYGLSVCRLYGDGSEWSDDDGTGPNVELDNFGLLLWAVGEHWRASGDDSLLREKQFLLLGGIADVLVGVQGEDGLIMADSSIWERHWNGNQQHFAYTQTWAWRGLQEASAMASHLGDAGRATTYDLASEELSEAICSQLIDEDGVLVASVEQLERGESYLDLAGVDAFNNGTLDAAGLQGQASLSAWLEGLATPAGGLARNDDGDSYDQQEWIWADLRAAQALRRSCRVEEARAIEDRLTAIAVANQWTIPELLDPDDASFRGPAPMMGFGAGLYMLTLLDRADAAADCADGVGTTCPADEDTGGDGGAPDGGTTDGGDTDGGDTDGGDTDGGTGDGGADTVDGGSTDDEPPKGSCGCASARSGAPGAGLLFLLLAAILPTRRRA